MYEEMKSWWESRVWEKYEEKKSCWENEEKPSMTEMWRKEELLRKGGKAEYDRSMKKIKVVEKRRKSRLWPPLQCHTRTPSVDWTCHTPPPDCDDDEVQYDDEEDAGDNDDNDGDCDGDDGDDNECNLHNLEEKSVLFAGRC